MSSLVQDIRNGQIANIYLFYGEEAFKKRHYKNLLKEAVAGSNLMNYSAFEGKDISWQEVYDASQTLPFFSAKRLVVVENSGKFKAKGSDTPETEDRSSHLMEMLIQNLPPTTCLAFFEETAAKNKKIYKSVAAKGVVTECNADSEEDLINWLAKGFAREGKKVRRSTLQLMIGRTGLDYDMLRMEFEKVVSYTGDRSVIEDADIYAITTETTESRIFDLLSAMSEKNLQRVLEKYHDLLVNREHPLYIMAMLRNQIRTMLQIAELSGQGLSNAQIAKTAGKPLFVVNRTMRSLRAFTGPQMEQMLDLIAETDRKCKSGEIQDQIGVELMLIQFSR